MPGNRTTGNQTSTRAVRAERIKDVVLPLMQRGGAIQTVSGMRVVQLSTGRFMFMSSNQTTDTGLVAL